MHPGAAAQLARRLLDEHGLTEWKVEILDLDWIGEADPETLTVRLSLGHVLLADEDGVRDTVLHEIAHCKTLAEPEEHGPKWQQLAEQLGTSPTPECRSAISLPPRPSMFPVRSIEDYGWGFADGLSHATAMFKAGMLAGGGPTDEVEAAVSAWAELMTERQLAWARSAIARSTGQVVAAA